jgi:hypothetical protein
MDRNDGIPHNLAADDLANLQVYIAANDPSGGWRYLAEHGDAYGVLASDIVRCASPLAEGTDHLWV